MSEEIGETCSPSALDAPVAVTSGSSVERFIVKHGWSDGDVKILHVLKETAARFQAVEYDNYRRTWERRPQHISKDAVIAEFCSEAAALAAVKHAKSVWASHEKRVNDTKSAHMQAIAQRRTTWISALKGENQPTDHQTTGAERRAEPIFAASHSLLNPNGETK